ncbi:DNA repair protein RadC [soil metagenome]
MPTALVSLPMARRPRERILQDVNQADLPSLLAALIGSGCTGRPLQTLVASVEEIITNTPSGTIPNFTQVKGIGKASAARLLAALNLSERLAALREPAALKNPQLLFEACQGIRFADQEHVLVLYLNTHLSLICQEVVTVGTVSSSLIHPREVFRAAISHNASHIALAHNHPSGVATPSDEDREATQRIAQAGKYIGINLIDHLICTRHSYTSLKMEAPELFC